MYDKNSQIKNHFGTDCKWIHHHFGIASIDMELNFCLGFTALSGSLTHTESFQEQFNTCIGLAPITQVTHMRNKNSTVQGRLPNVVKVIFHTKWHWS